MSFILVMPDALPTAMLAATNTSQSAMARHGWVALQRATRTVIGRGAETWIGDTALPFVRMSLLTPITLPPTGCGKHWGEVPADGGVFPTGLRAAVRQDGLVIQGFGPRLRNVLWAGAATGLAAACLVLFVLTVTSAALITVWVGLPILFGDAGLRPADRRAAPPPPRRDRRQGPDRIALPRDPVAATSSSGSAPCSATRRAGATRSGSA